MLEFTFLGTSPGLPLPDRFGQTIVMSAGGKLTLLDVGDGASSFLMRGGFDHLQIGAIVISHMHADHHGGLAQVLKTSMHLKRDEGLIILAPGEGIAAFQAYLIASYLYEDWLGYPIRWISLAATSSLELPGEVALRAFENNHLGSARDRFAGLGKTDHGRSFESYSFSLESGGKRVIYSGNLLGPNGSDEMTSYIEPADLLLCELAHLDPVQVGRFLHGKAIRQAVFAHISPKWQGVPDEDVLSMIRGEGLGTEVAIARDGDRVSVG